MASDACATDEPTIKMRHGWWWPRAATDNTGRKTVTRAGGAVVDATPQGEYGLSGTASLQRPLLGILGKMESIKGRGGCGALESIPVVVRYAISFK